jgi:hypothetical protein
MFVEQELASKQTTVAEPDIETAGINFEAPEELRRAVRMLALQRRTTAKELWKLAMKEFLERNQQ